ncbi:MAG: alanine:cation symporter family protein, partial [Lachnospiraceae bacterium]|nr:alanine:cation symporter family protein [Lachnospiraceae bacterium]
MAIYDLISTFTNWLWGVPILILLVGGGIIIAFLIKGVQFVKFGFVWKNTMGTLFDKEEQAKKKALGVSPFQVLVAAVGATVGTGNIVGVGSAIAIGGPGALFWMWICGFIAMGIKYSEVTLAVAYRKKNTNGEYRGGPFMYIRDGLKWKPIAYIFGFLMIVCIAIICCVHGSSMASNFASIGVNKYITMICCVVFMGAVIFGGMKMLVKISDKLVPVMSFLYIAAALIVIIINIKNLPAVFISIFQGAFTGTAAVGGFTGAVFAQALRNGLARGVFSNDAGLGLSASIQSQAEDIDHPAQQ